MARFSIIVWDTQFKMVLSCNMPKCYLKNYSFAPGFGSGVTPSLWWSSPSQLSADVMSCLAICHSIHICCSWDGHDTQSIIIQYQKASAMLAVEMAMIHGVSSYNFRKLQPLQSNTIPHQKASGVCPYRMTPYSFRRLQTSAPLVL